MWSIKLLKVQVTCRVVVGYNVQIRVHYYAEWIIIGIKTGGDHKTGTYIPKL